MLKLLRPLVAAIVGLCPLSALAQSAGTIPLAMAQQFGPGGVPLAGCLLYSYVAGTVATPAQGYADFGLTQALPNPTQCDQTGRVPLIWYPSGLIHIRLTDSSGVVQVDTTMQVLGPSSGGGGGGGTVDPTTVLATGDVKSKYGTGPLSGFVRANGLTIGSATSGATERANADTQNLFVYLWNADPNLVVTGGRGANALADFSANKQITLPDLRGRVPVGLDDMGNSAAGRLTVANFGSINVTTLGAAGGGAAVLAQNQLPNVNFNVSGIALNNGPLSITTNVATNTNGSNTGIAIGGVTALNINWGASPFNFVGASNVTVNAPGGVQGIAASGGTGVPFSEITPAVLMTIYIKL